MQVSILQKCLEKRKWRQQIKYENVGEPLFYVFSGHLPAQHYLLTETDTVVNVEREIKN